MNWIHTQSKESYLLDLFMRTAAKIIHPLNCTYALHFKDLPLKNKIYAAKALYVLLTVLDRWRRWEPGQVELQGLSVTRCTWRRCPSRPWRWEPLPATLPCPRPTSICTWNKFNAHETSSSGLLSRGIGRVNMKVAGLLKVFIVKHRKDPRIGKICQKLQLVIEGRI